MIAVDTNVLLRYLLDDHPSQSLKAQKLINARRTILITDVVLAETVWTLRGSKYRLGKAALVAMIQSLFEEPNIRFEDGAVVWKALNDYRESKPVKGKTADFADALIVNKARFVAIRQNSKSGGAYTFDVAAQSLSGAKALT